MRKRSLEALSTLREPRHNYHDPNGYVFLDIPISEAKDGWVQLTAEQEGHVRALNDVDKKRYDAWHRPKED